MKPSFFPTFGSPPYGLGRYLGDNVWHDRVPISFSATLANLAALPPNENIPGTIAKGPTPRLYDTILIMIDSLHNIIVSASMARMETECEQQFCYYGSNRVLFKLNSISGSSFFIYYRYYIFGAQYLQHRNNLSLALNLYNIICKAACSR